MHKVISASLFQ